MSAVPRIRRSHPNVDEHAVALHPAAWNPPAVIAVGLGAGYLALGVAGLARTGLSLAHLDRPYADVIGFRHSPLLGLAEVAVGVLLVLVGASGGARRLMAVVGALVTGLGLVLVVDVASGAFHRWLGVAAPYGWLSLIVGVFLLVTAGFLPDVTPEDAGAAHRNVAT